MLNSNTGEKPFAYKGLAIPEDSSSSEKKNELRPANEAIPEVLKELAQESPKKAQGSNTGKSTQPMSIRDDSRFWIALSIILGMMIILIITVIQAQYAQTTQLSGIFSGWVTTIIAFYFMGKTTSKAQTQAKASAQLQAKAESKVQYYEKKVGRIRDIISMHESLAEEKSAAARQAWDKIKTIIDETP